MSEGEQVTLAVWGLGNIGRSTLLGFANSGFRVVGIDTSIQVCEELGRRDEWGHLSKSIRVSQCPVELAEEVIVAHFICVPTERDGEPWPGALEEVAREIFALIDAHRVADRDPPLVVIESTITPRWLDSIIGSISADAGLVAGRDYLLGAAPRRDWLTTENWNLRNTPRVIGGHNDEATQAMRQIISHVSDALILAPDDRHAVMVKLVENSLRFLDISFANELAREFSDMNVRAILELAGSKWNIENYYPSLGIGGYCVPLAPRHLLESGDGHRNLPLITHAISTQLDQVDAVASLISSMPEIRSVGILGISYLGDVKVNEHSPGIKLCAELRRRNLNVMVNDPMYSETEIRKICDSPLFNLLDGNEKPDAIVLTIGHTAYSLMGSTELSKVLRSVRLVIDCTGTWSDRGLSSLVSDFRVIGTPGWLATRETDAHA